MFAWLLLFDRSPHQCKGNMASRRKFDAKRVEENQIDKLSCETSDKTSNDSENEWLLIEWYRAAQHLRLWMAIVSLCIYRRTSQYRRWFVRLFLSLCILVLVQSIEAYVYEVILSFASQRVQTNRWLFPNNEHHLWCTYSSTTRISVRTFVQEEQDCYELEKPFLQTNSSSSPLAHCV